MAKLIYLMVRYTYSKSDNDQATANTAEDQGLVQRGWGGRLRLTQAVAYSLCREDLYPVYPAAATDVDADAILDSDVAVTVIRVATD